MHIDICAGQAIGCLGLVPEHLEGKDRDFELGSTESRKIQFLEATRWKIEQQFFIIT